jgi:peroxiredoxin
MPVTQRFVHGGLCLVAALLLACVVVLALGASRSTVNNAGLPGSLAPPFTLRDSGGEWWALKDNVGKITVILFAPASEAAAVSPRQLEQVCAVYKADELVSMLGVQYSDDSSIQSVEQMAREGRLAAICPELRLLNDIDRSVARAFRVIDSTPTFFVIDEHGTIRGRIPLNDSAAIAVSETINSLKAPAAPEQTLAPNTSTASR